MPMIGKRLRAARERVDRERMYDLPDAVTLVKDTATAQFDETVELHINTGLDGRHADQQIRGSVSMPHGLGRVMRVAVFAEGEAVQLAIDAGADEVGSDDLIDKIAGGDVNFDAVIAQRELMGKVGRLGRVLGPRGLMPNPRSNTVLDAADIPRAVQEARTGRVEFRLDRTNVVHCPVGKVSFTDEALLDNLATLVGEIVKAKPSGAKGHYIRGATLTSTMGPGVHLDVRAMLAFTDET